MRVWGFLGVVAGVAHVVVTAGSMSGQPGGMIDRSLIRMVWSAGEGRAVGIRSLGLLLVIRVATSPRPPAWRAIAGAVLAATSFAWVGHAHSLSPSAAPILLLSVHLLGVAFWLGALAPLLILSSAGNDARTAAAVLRFSAVAIRVVGVLLVAGVSLAWVLLGRFSDLWVSDYGVFWDELCGSEHTNARRRRTIGVRTEHQSSVIATSPSSPRQNYLLAALPDAQWQLWRSQLESVEMPLGQVLYESGATLSHVYFPTTAIVSLLYVMENGASAEIAVVGNEGIVGISLFMGGESTPSRAVVQSAGHGFRLKAQLMKNEFNKSGPVLHLLLRYTQALITQMAQTAVCNRHHSLDQQLCRWLLLSLDRLAKNELIMTQELIANMLGVRREGVTEGALKLQQDGLIRYSRGRITILDRPALELRTCECYAVVKKEYDRLLPGTEAQ